MPKKRCLIVGIADTAASLTARLLVSAMRRLSGALGAT